MKEDAKMKKIITIILIPCIVFSFVSCNEFKPNGDFISAGQDSYRYKGNIEYDLTSLGSGYYKIDGLSENDWLAKYEYSLYSSYYILFINKDLSYDPLVDWPVSSIEFVSSEGKPKIVLTQDLMEQLLALLQDSSGWSENNDSSTNQSREFKIHFENQKYIYFYGWVQIDPNGEYTLARQMDTIKVGKKIPEALAKELSVLELWNETTE